MTTNGTKPDVVPSSATSSEEPLLSGGGRDFLDGKIDADEYIDATRQIAATLVWREFNRDLRKERKSLQKNTEGVLFLAAGAYAILGGATLIIGSALIGATAFVTGIAFATLGGALSIYFRRHTGANGPIRRR